MKLGSSEVDQEPVAHMRGEIQCLIARMHVTHDAHRFLLVGRSRSSPTRLDDHYFPCRSQRLLAIDRFMLANAPGDRPAA